MALIHYEKDFDKLIEHTAVVDFYATWCGPCKMFGPIFEEVSNEKDMNFIKLNVDDYSDIAREYGITRASITQWRKKYGTIITSTGEVTNNDEILKLKKELQQVKMENEILKKVVAIFSKK